MAVGYEVAAAAPRTVNCRGAARQSHFEHNGDGFSFRVRLCAFCRVRRQHPARGRHGTMRMLSDPSSVLQRATLKNCYSSNLPSHRDQRTFTTPFNAD